MSDQATVTFVLIVIGGSAGGVFGLVLLSLQDKVTTWRRKRQGHSRHSS